MNKRKWYLKKRMGLMIFIALFFLGGRMEFAKFRYDPAQLAQTILQHGQLQPVFGTKNKDGKTIQFLKIGNRPDLPLVVFVHGSPGALNAYESYLSDTILSQKADLLAIDRMGFGYSDFGETESSLITQSAMIAMVLEDFPQQKKILVGHSMGGPVIARLAVDYPDLVDGLVMVAPSISPQLEPSNTWRRVMDFCLICWMTPPALRVCNQEIIPLQGELEQLVRDWKCLEIPVTVV
ncbi:MAG TPA: alpha/beta fold hydrolase, partial [Phaeodactylibacter sp.]|nr:alpha/beta fold hydrolase [Phaeodactylibacter sp.]